MSAEADLVPCIACSHALHSQPTSPDSAKASVHAMHLSLPLARLLSASSSSSSSSPLADDAPPSLLPAGGPATPHTGSPDPAVNPDPDAPSSSRPVVPAAPPRDAAASGSPRSRCAASASCERARGRQSPKLLTLPWLTWNARHADHVTHASAL